jgi:hypothetical protein
MIPARAAGPGPRRVALKLAAPILICLMLAVAVAACGTAAPSGGTAPSAPSGSSAPIGQPPSTTPGGSAGVGASPEPSPPRWPGTTVLAVIALGAADGEIQKAGDDLQKAADAQDLRAMWGAADGLAKMIDGLMPNLDRLDSYPLTQPVGQLYGVAFPELAAGAKHLRDSITAGDSAGVVAGSQQIAKALADYSPIRQKIADLVEQAIVQQRLYLE